MDIKIKRKLGTGVMGTVYLSEINGIKSITKIERYNGDMTTKSPYIRQLKFNELAKKYPNNFLVLVFSGVVEKCEHDNPIIRKKRFNKNKMQYLMKINKWEKCSLLSYKPVLDGDLGSIIHKLNSKQSKNALYQIVTCLNIMKKHGYKHRDSHVGNIMYKRINRISAKQKLLKYQWFLIDYGMISHKSFIKNWHDKYDGGKVNEILKLVKSFTVDKMGLHIRDKKLKLRPYEEYIKKIKESIHYNDIKKYLPKTTNKRLLNESMVFITKIKYHKFSIYGRGFDINKYKKYISKQMNEKILLYMVKHCLDKNYSNILNYIR